MAYELVELFDDPRVHLLTGTVDDGAIMFLSAREAAAVNRAAQRRVREYATARALARAGMERFFGVRDFDLLNAEDRAPVWPPGITGSVSHTPTRAWVALVDDDFGTIGIDGESRDGLEPRLWHLVLHREEIAYLESLAPSVRTRCALMLFCAKEALYKAQYPRSRRLLGFMSVRVQLLQDGTLRGVFQQEAPPFPAGFAVRGRWQDDGQVLACAWIPRA